MGLPRDIRVLLIDDSPADAALITSSLAQAGYELVTQRAADPTECCTALDEAVWDIIICDDQVSQLSAHAALELVRARGLNVPFIVISGTSDEQAAGALLRAGAYDHLMRSNLAQLGPSVDHALRAAGELSEAGVLYEAAALHRATHDGLTDLPNRALLRVRLDEALLDPTSSFALLLLDLDRFKEVNDTLGHQAGDSLLQLIGQRLRQVVLPTDLVARLGGDEYAILLPSTDATRAAEMAGDVRRVLHTPFVLNGHPIAVDVSIGIALAPEHGQDADSLLRCADIAMYQAKRSRTGPTVYRPDHDHYRPDRLALLGELRNGIDRDELLLYYQPKLDLRAGTLVGVEALVRWQHPQRGFLSPGEFIPLAEETGLINPLSLWVLEAALRQHQAWRAMGMDIPVAVNLSRRLLQDERLPEMVGDLLARCDVAPTALVLEITESSLMADPVRAGENLHQLRALGVRMSIDDFGTGYSSLASLKNLLVDELKIDQSFVQAMATDASSRAIVRAIIDLADALKLRVVAEGVEDRATWDVLAGLGCDVAQGYLLSPPLAAAELTAWVTRIGPAWQATAAQQTVEDPLQERIRSRGARLTAEEEFIARKQSEAALLASEERNRLALQAARMGTWDRDLVHDVLTWSSETEALHGLGLDTFDRTIAAFQRLVYPLDWAAVHVEISTAKLERPETFATYRTIWPDGSVHWIEIRSRAQYSANGTVVRITGTSMDVTERKRAEEALQVSEERNRLALQAARMGTWDVDLVKNVHVWSVETEALFGLPPGGFGRSFEAFKSLVHPDDWPTLEIEDAAAKAEHRASVNTYRTIWPDGTVHWIEEMGSPLYDEQGGLLRLTGTSMDVTARKQAEEALRVSEERNRLALQAARMATWDWDVVRNIHTWSNGTLPGAGQALGTFERTFDDFKSSVHPDDWAAVEAEEHAAQAERRDSITTFRTLAIDGTVRWMESRGRSLYAEDGTLLRVTGTSMDITERKVAEEALRTSEERFRKQYKSFPLPTYSWRQDGDDFVLQDFNDAAEATTGGRIGDWLGIRASDHYADQAGMQESLWTCVQERKSVRRETRFRDQTSGRERQLVLSYVFVPPHTVMVHSEDVTDLKHAEQQRTALAQSEKLRALGQMASGIAHDLNQSLMLVASYGELARQAMVQHPPNLAELEDLLTTTTQAAMDGGETVKRLLLFTRAAPEQNSQPVDLSKVLIDAAQLTAPRWRDASQAAGQPIALHVEAAGHPTIQGSASQLRDLMTNVIFNAVDALPAGGTIRLGVVAEDGEAIIEVTDSGVGMTAEVQERVFEPFFTTKGEGGTGMGLAMVFGIVEHHGGRIEVRSAPGEGTTVRIALPLVAESTASAASTPPPLQLAPPQPLRVLIVDDEPMMTRAVTRMLKPSGHLVTVAGSGEEALQKLAAQPFDVVVSDMGMGPGMNGWDLADAVKQHYPPVRFLLATGWGAAIDPAEAKAKGVEGVLAKPYHPVDLLQALARTPAAA